MGRVNDPVKAGLVGLRFGAGLAVRDLIDAHGGEFVRLTAACDLQKDKVDDFAGKYSLPAYTSMDDMLANADIEAVLLMTPPENRAKLIRKCLDAGKHVLTTKPFELDAAAAKEVLLLAKERNLALHLNSPAPLPACDLAQIRAWQKKYDLGRPVSAHWETYVSKAEKADGSWLDSFDKCPVAPVFRIGIYGINELTAIFGEAEDVEVTTSRILTTRPTPDNAQILIRFANGGIGSVFASFCIGDGMLYNAGLTLHFENGTIWKEQTRLITDTEFTGVDMRLRAVVDGKVTEEAVTLPALDRSGAYQYENFYNAVRNGISDGEISPDDVIAGIKIINLMAAKEKRI